VNNQPRQILKGGGAHGAFLFLHVVWEIRLRG
jgi:hypothetical protein